MPRAEVEDRQTKHWNAVADGWAAWLDWTERNFGPLTAWLQQAAGWTPGIRALDIACGPGYPARAAARAVSPGRVVAIDASPQMVAVAARRARTDGIENIELVTMDAEALEFPDGSFDAATNAYGLMFCADPLRALEEAHRVLAPRARVAVVTWADASESPFFTVIRGVAAATIGLAEPPPGERGPFRFSSPEELRTLLEQAGFSGVTVERRSMTFEYASAAEYCRMFGDIAWSAKMSALSDAEAAAFRDAVAVAAQRYADGCRLRLAAASLCASAEK
jgi:ubiquinone/menaquinone biosynthesis C-methylase UbiE